MSRAAAKSPAASFAPCNDLENPRSLGVTLGLITVVYSSAGGIKAVIVTDALQSLTMIAGGIITIAVITYQLGGVSA